VKLGRSARPLPLLAAAWLVAAACSEADEPRDEPGAAGDSGGEGGDGGDAPEAGRPAQGGAPAGAAGDEAGGAGAGAAAHGGTRAGSGAHSGEAGDAAGGAEAGGPGNATGGSARGGDGGTAGSGRGGRSSAGAANGAALRFDVDVLRASDVQPTAPGTVGIVTFSTNVANMVAARIDFGLDQSYGTTVPVDLTSAGYRTLLLGMKPSRTYHFKITVSNGTREYESVDYRLETGPAPVIAPYAGLTVLDAARRERGFILLSYRERDSREVPFIIDADGEIVWWFFSSSPGVGRAVMSEDAKNLWLVPPGNSGAPLTRVSMDTLDSEVYPATMGSHDITAVTGDKMAFIEYGEDDCDSVWEIDPSGVTVERFESEGVIDARTCHGNAIRYSRTEDLYTYSDRFNGILALDRSGAVRWQLSDFVPGGNDTWGGAQHGHHLLDASILIFANEGMARGISAAIEYDFEGNELRRFQSGLYTAHMGDAQRLPGGNTLLTFSNASIVQEFDTDGSVVLEVDGGGAPLGYSMWRDSLYGPSPDSTL
jgi:hypothetical protein